MIRCQYNDHIWYHSLPEDTKPCPNEAKWLGCDPQDITLCDEHRCRCRKPIVVCECNGDFKHCPMCKGEGWMRVK